MSKNTDICRRQNDKSALTLLKASYRCLRNERIAKYIMIFLSFGICLTAILNKYLAEIAPKIPNVAQVRETAATYITLISGVILVTGIAMGFYTSRMHNEGTVLRDRYEAYAFDNPPNLSMLRPISQTVINIYAHRTRKSDDAFRNVLYEQGDDPDPDTAQFNYINKEAHSDYSLYISIQPFFYTLWIGFCLIIVILAVTFNDSFITTLNNIMIPSLSAITTIGNSWYSCRLQTRQLQNLLAVIDQIQSLPDEKRLAYIRDKRNMRALADGLYNYRISAFVIPNFLVRRHIRNSSENSVSLQLPGEKRSHKTEMPSLILPDIEDDIPEISRIINNNSIRTVTFSRTHTVDDINVAANKRRYTGRSRNRVGLQSEREAARTATAKPAAARSAKPAATPAPAPRPAARTAKPAAEAKTDKTKKDTKK